MRYNDSIAVEDRNKSHTRIVRLVPEGSKVLDVGCSTGFLGEYLIREKKCVVDGIEYDEEAGRLASKRLNLFISGDVEDEGLLKKLAGKTYDVIIAGDILEHLKDPSGLLKRLSRFLADNGMIIISLPNIAHLRVRTNLLLGRFEYTEGGIMDSTHLRFFTHETARRLIGESGYSIVLEEHTLGPRIGGLPLLGRVLPKKVFASQFIFVARPVRR